MSEIDIIEKKLDKIQTCQKKIRQNLDKFRTPHNLEKFSQNLDKFRTPRFTDEAIKPRFDAIAKKKKNLCGHLDS